jgi:hypothetical protein
MRIITLGQALDAIEKNGYPQAFGAYHDQHGAYCAVGQGAKNLGISPSYLASGLNKIQLKTGCLDHKIFDLNDKSQWTPQRIGKHYKRLLADKLETVIIAQI